MANGTHLDHIVRFGTTTSTGTTATNVITIDVSNYTGVDCMIYLRGWVKGTRTDDSIQDSYTSVKIADGYIKDGILVIAAESETDFLDFESSTYSVDFATNGSVIELQGSGAAGHTIRWMGRL